MDLGRERGQPFLAGVFTKPMLGELAGVVDGLLHAWAVVATTTDAITIRLIRQVAPGVTPANQTV